MKIKLLKDCGNRKAGEVFLQPRLCLEDRDGWTFVYPEHYELIPEEPRTTLSRRDEFAKAALSGFCANSYYAKQLASFNIESAQEIRISAQVARSYADALIAELDKEKV